MIVMLLIIFTLEIFSKILKSDYDFELERETERMQNKSIYDRGSGVKKRKCYL